MPASHFVEFLVMRHGQTVADVNQVFSKPDDPLTEKGLHDARLAARWIACNCPPMRILSSPFIRARRTAEEVSRGIGVDVEVDQDLRERDNGDLAGQIKDPTNLRSYLPDETAPGGETLIAFRARAKTLWARLMKRSDPGQRILIVSHGQMIGMLFRCFLKRPADDSVRLKTGDTGIHCWKVDGNSRTIVFSNSQTHLEIAAPHEGVRKSDTHTQKKRRGRTT